MLRGARPTLRGTLLLLVGIVLTVAAAAIGEPDLMWAGLFLCALPLLALVVVLALRPSLRFERELTPPQVAVGDGTQAVIRLRNVNPVAATTLQLRDAAPDSLGGGAEFVVARAFGRWEQAVRYRISTRQRGRFLVGPLTAHAGDPLGLAVASVRPVGDDTLLRVTPQIRPLAEVGQGLGVGATGEASPQRSGQAGQDDVLVREHRHGDDIRRVHWRMTAKQDELMVRMEEHPWDPSALLVVDLRRDHHTGTGPDSSLEWSISAAASLAVRLADTRHRIVIAGGSGTIFEPHQLRGPAQRVALVDALTEVAPSDETDLAAIFGESESLDATGRLAYFGGVLTVADVNTLTAMSRRLSKPCALVLDPEAWRVRAPEHADAVRLLRQHGWAVEQYEPGAAVERVWNLVVLRQAAA